MTSQPPEYTLTERIGADKDLGIYVESPDPSVAFGALAEVFQRPNLVATYVHAYRPRALDVNTLIHIRAHFTDRHTGAEIVHDVVIERVPV